MKKVLSILLIFIIIIFMLSNVVFADPISSMKDYNSGSGNSTLSNVGSKLYGIILIVGSAVALITLAVMAIWEIKTAENQIIQVVIGD